MVRSKPVAETTGQARALTVLRVLLVTAIVVSIVHYVDNVVAYDRFPTRDGLPSPSRTLVGASWFLFTAFGVAGYVLFRRGELRLAAVALAGYSGSGLVGLGHYAAPEMLDAVWWRQAHVIADIACGLAILGFAVWLVWPGHRSTSAELGK
jgi:hypothetical protein